MTTRPRAAAALATFTLALFLNGCTGGTESSAAGDEPARDASAAEVKVDAKKAIATINPAIPIYQGADYREDLTRRDRVTIRNQFGPNAEVYTLATDDSFPQVFHYYTTYLAQFRAFPARDTYPPERQDWRTLEVQLNQAMQDPFFPGLALNPNGQQVTLQIAETEAEPRTVIRYIVTPRA
ncbi:MAG TPA: hypothetical protein VHL59_00545, partial [Thermoanaerobaculia bacterium]|nr:hypothetical protein [Thermoanaerobaculia bacterium]